MIWPSAAQTVGGVQFEVIEMTALLERALDQADGGVPDTEAAVLPSLR